MNNLHSNALLQSIKDAPLLLGALPEAASLDRALLGMPTSGMRLNTNQKLGHLYEDALRLLLSESDQLELLADHVQVFDRKQITLGEMDYILRAVRTQQVFQLELAVKFYLGVPTADGWQFPGPDPHDNWQRKLQHMRTHQLPLAQRPEAMSLLRERWGCERVEVRQLSTAVSFIRWEWLSSPCRKACARIAERVVGCMRRIGSAFLRESQKSVWFLNLCGRLR